MSYRIEVKKSAAMNILDAITRRQLSLRGIDPNEKHTYLGDNSASTNDPPVSAGDLRLKAQQLRSQGFDDEARGIERSIELVEKSEQAMIDKANRQEQNRRRERQAYIDQQLARMDKNRLSPEQAEQAASRFAADFDNARPPVTGNTLDG